jgi:hypothetical protein
MGAPRKDFVASRVLDYIERAKRSTDQEMPLVLEVICAFISDDPKRPIKKDTVYHHMGGAKKLRLLLDQAKILQARNATTSASVADEEPQINWKKRHEETLAKLIQIEYWAESVGISKEALNAIYAKRIPPPDRSEPSTGSRGFRDKR